MIWTVNPVDVAVLVPNVGVNAANREVAGTVSEPLACPAKVVVIVAVELVAAATPVTVTKPVLLTDTEPPDSDDVPAHR